MTCRTTMRKVCAVPTISCLQTPLTIIIVLSQPQEWFTLLFLFSLTVESVHSVRFVCLFTRSMACPYWRLCGVCTATHRNQKYSSVRAALPQGTSTWGFLQSVERSERRTRGPHWAENYVAFSTLRTEIFYTAETLYMCVCVCAYVHI